MTTPVFPTATTVASQWEEQKQALMREQSQELQEVYGNTAKFDADGPKRVSSLKLENWVVTAPTMAAAAVGIIAIGAAGGLALVGVLGMMALGKVVFDFKQRSHYNDAVGRYDQAHEALKSAQTPEAGAKVLEQAQAAIPQVEAKFNTYPKLLGIVLGGAVIGLAASAMAPVIGLALATAAGVAAGVAGGAALGEAFKEESTGTLVEKAMARSRGFADKLFGQRDEKAAEIGIKPDAPGSVTP